MLKQTEKFLNSESITAKNALCICLGKKGKDFFKKRGFEIIYFEENKRDNVREIDMKRLTDIIIEKHLNKETKSWNLIYTNFESTFEQHAVRRRLFPLSRVALEEVIAAIIPTKGKYADEKIIQKQRKQENIYTIEEKEKNGNIFEQLVPLLGNILLYHALLESKASEHSARMVAMKGATDTAGELSKTLQIKFNKARQAAITREIGEITSGIESMKN